MRSNRASKTGIQLKMFRKQLTKQFRGLSIIHTMEQCEGSNFSSGSQWLNLVRDEVILRKVNDPDSTPLDSIVVNEVKCLREIRQLSQHLRLNGDIHRSSSAWLTLLFGYQIVWHQHRNGFHPWSICRPSLHRLSPDKVLKRWGVISQ